MVKISNFDIEFTKKYTQKKMHFKISSKIDVFHKSSMMSSYISADGLLLELNFA